MLQLVNMISMEADKATRVNRHNQPTDGQEDTVMANHNLNKNTACVGYRIVIFWCNTVMFWCNTVSFGCNTVSFGCGIVSCIKLSQGNNRFKGIL